ncbi:hypothetical protein G6F46_000878 [Rhizopus delemar]|uniref:Rap-GAP domain-containing protein n=2 Tax=Rhizopus TaxID=4842 RepID=A0A9P6ZEM3_9FUNG|nr:hypothetical protein G6F43_006159 [Rhizopus delemar]KAG1553186.1 hypothetical protein G6F51_000754 [Rhizopus arrhizus]KAG1466696.1 hypothetical protein G6F55_000320 [Rhizopus delemar]KAG1504975.1 hypothetical protein G6F54_000635 [Rhizopus delemar]KAG1518346.1 hypothetical protein G6F53_000665 [Rhizopus delemar]
MSSFKLYEEESNDDSKWNKRDDVSIYSTSSSVFSTSSRLGKIPSAVKSSVKHIFRDSTSRIKRNTSILFRKNNTTETTARSITKHQCAGHIDEQEEQTPMLHQLAHNNLGGLFLFKGLITTTLTTLHTRLTNECDRTLVNVLTEQQENREFPREQLASIIIELYKMSEMVRWEDEEELKRQVKRDISRLDKQLDIVYEKDAIVSSVKEIINNMKQVMNQCICQYYKVVENAMVIPCKGYRIEGKNNYKHQIEPITQVIISDQVEHMDKDAYWYRNYFMGNSNVCHFFGYHHGDPLLVSAAVEYIDNKKQYRIIYRSKENSDQRRLIEDSFLLNAPTENTSTVDIPNTTWKTIIESLFNIPFHSLKKMSFDIMSSSGLEQSLLKLDEYCLHKRYKFGVLLVKEGQTKEEEWFANQHDSSKFDYFLNIIGHRVQLKDYTGWSAGLDRKGGDSGEYIYTNTWHEHVLAYHVSTLIPSKIGDKQQVQRKRHIGNDIVCIVFVEGNQPFNPSAIKSQFLHVFIVVHQEEKNKKKLWRVEVVSVEDVPPFGPLLPHLFDNEKDLSDFILAKLINAEYAALKSPKFSIPMARARENLFLNIVEKGWKLLDEGDKFVISDTSSTTSNNSVNSHKKSHTKTASSSSSISIRTLADSFIPPPAIEKKATQAAAVATIGHIHLEQFPSIEQFDAIIHDYLQNLSTKKRDKALVDNHRYAMILQVLKDPRNTSVSTAQFRFWVKKMFCLMNDTVCHDDKPVATRESIYHILVIAHKEAHHGGRDKTSALVRRQYSWIPKELIARFVRHCPYCISKRNGNTNEPKTPPIYKYSHPSHSATAAAAAAVVASSFIAAHHPSISTNTTRLYFPSKQEVHDFSPQPYHHFIADQHSCAAAAAIVAAAAMAAIKSNHSADSLSS